MESAPVAILVALREEMRPLEKQVSRRRPGRAGPLRFQHAFLDDIPVQLVRTGMGKEHAARATGLLLEHARPALILSTGFAGALDTTLSCGDVLVAEEVVTSPAPPAGDFSTPSRQTCSASLVTRLTERKDGAGPRLRVGRLLTVEKALASPNEKIEAGTRFQAQAVDMESSAILACARRSDVPAVCVRVILDETGDSLPFDFGRILTPEGRVRPLETARALARHPRGLLDLDRLRRRAAVAARRLGEVVPEIAASLVD